MWWIPPLIIAAMFATWIAAYVRRSNRLSWAVAIEAMILIGSHAIGLGWAQ